MGRGGAAIVHSDCAAVLLLLRCRCQLRQVCGLLLVRFELRLGAAQTPADTRPTKCKCLVCRVEMPDSDADANANAVEQ